MSTVDSVTVEKTLFSIAETATRLSGPFQSGFLMAVEEIASRLNLCDELRHYSTRGSE